MVSPKKADWKSTLANFALFQSGWFLAVLLQTPWALVWAAIFIVIHSWFYASSQERKALLLIILLGLLIDFIWQLTPFIHYLGDGFGLPYWLFGLWLMFPLTLNHSLSWLKGRTLLQIIFGVIGGGGSYVAGTRLGAAEAPVWGLAVVALAWGIWLPMFYRILDQFLKAPSIEVDEANHA